MTGWTFGAEPAGSGAGAVTLVEGSSFCLSSGNGDIVSGLVHGVFFRDTRVLSHWSLLVDEEPVDPLSVLTWEPFWASFVGRAAPRPGKGESTMLVQRDRRVGTGMREDVCLRNFGREAVGCTIRLVAEADFADLFEVKEGRVRTRGERTVRAEDERLQLDYQWRGRHRGVVVEAAGATTVTPQEVVYRVVVPARGQWQTTLIVHPVIDGEKIETHFQDDGSVDESPPARRIREWRLGGPVVFAERESLVQVLERSQQDLGALRIFDPRHPERPVIAAGAPWFMALFGRDSLISSWFALPVDQSLALGTLQTLADYQGRKENPLTEEQPGRILHEVRLGVETGAALAGGVVYYGTADATPLFVALLGEVNRWGVPRDELTALLPNADRALEWVQRWGDRDGDGFVEYERATDQGLVNQGWKDSWDGVNFADGRIAEAPIALCEVQGYVYQAYLARARLAAERGDTGGARRWRDRAAELKEAFNQRFWMPERGWYAIALDRDKQLVDACTSNMGHCLWSGIVDDDKAAAVAERLLSPQMFTGWGVRTLASDMGAYNPMSYHNGSVWPHDSTIVAAGLMRYGFVEQAQRIATGILDAAERFGGRLPELFCGFDRQEYPEPVPYPTSCSPQAWAAASPVHLVRELLRFDPDLPAHRLRVAPALPPGFGRLRIENIPLAGARLSLDVLDNQFTVQGLPEGVQVLRDVTEEARIGHA